MLLYRFFQLTSTRSKWINGSLTSAEIIDNRHLDPWVRIPLPLPWIYKMLNINILC